MGVPNDFKNLIGADDPRIFCVGRIVLACRWSSLAIETTSASDHPFALPSLADVFDAFFDLVRLVLEVFRLRAAFHFGDEYVHDFVVLPAIENSRLPLRRLECLPESHFLKTLRVLLVVI
jgi:hypothetical protein